MYTKFKTLILPVGVCAVLILVFGAALIGGSAGAADAVHGERIPAPQAHLDNAGNRTTAQAVLAGGCFWGMELVFSHVKGVTNVVAGYAGGDKAHANYRDSSSGLYGDAESVRITYDPSKVSYGELLQIYFSVAHNPTEVNRQGPDAGPEYRSEVFAGNKQQAQMTRAYIRQMDAAHVFNKPIATKVSVGESFFPAEAYHQDFAVQHPIRLYIQINDMPKLGALEKRFPKWYTKDYADGQSGSKTVRSDG